MSGSSLAQQKAGSSITSLFRLPLTVLPVHYDLEIDPELAQGEFAGCVSIQLEVRQPVTEVVLNAVGLEIHGASMASEEGGTIWIDAVHVEEKTERVILALSSEIPPGVYTVKMKFTGRLSDGLIGFYRCRFKDAEGMPQWLAATQMQGTNARRVFPCFDEPAFKASFSNTLIVPTELIALSNTPVETTSIRSDGKLAVHFEKTIKIPPYLVAFIAGPMEYSGPTEVDGMMLRVFCTYGKKRLTSFAMETAAFALHYFSGKYGMPCPGSKLDQVAIPEFAANGMENLGCITYREAVVLLDPAKATQAETVRSADVIAHEIAHMWFGNLVTMEWWNGLWLNEAFATFMGISCVAEYKPAWDRWTKFSVERSRAFEVDSLENPRTLEYHVESPFDAIGMLDVLTYQKGASLLRMLEQFLGTDIFFQGIRSYLTKHTYGNTTSADLWQAIESAAALPVAAIMNSWVFQAGYPLISVSLSADRTTLKLKQERFCFNQAKRKHVELFQVPLQFCSSSPAGTHEHKMLLKDAMGEFKFDVPVDAVVMNAGACGYYRVQYEPALLLPLVTRIEQMLSPVQRYILVDDIWATVLSGSVTAQQFLEFLSGWHETDLNIWALLSNCFDSIDRLLKDRAREEYTNIVKALAWPIHQRLAWIPMPGESSQDRELRGIIIRLLGLIACDPEIVEKARRLYRDGSSANDPNVAAAIAEIVAANGDDSDYETVLERSKNSSTPQENVRHQRLLGIFPGSKQMKRTLEMCVNGEVPAQDAPHLVALCLRNRSQSVQVWQFIKDNWEYMNRYYPPISIAPLLAGVTTLDRPDQVDDVLEFFKTHDVPQGRPMMLQHLERLRINAAFRKREAVCLSNALITKQCGFAIIKCSP